MRTRTTSSDYIWLISYEVLNVEPVHVYRIIIVIYFVKITNLHKTYFKTSPIFQDLLNDISTERSVDVLEFSRIFSMAKILLLRRLLEIECKPVHEETYTRYVGHSVETRCRDCTIVTLCPGCSLVINRGNLNIVDLCVTPNGVYRLGLFQPCHNHVEEHSAQ